MKLKNEFPDNEILFLYEFFPVSFSYLRKKLMNAAAVKARGNNIRGVNIENVPELNYEFIEFCKAGKLKSYCWVVNDPQRAQYLNDSGIDGITTDRPGWLKKQMHNLSD